MPHDALRIKPEERDALATHDVSVRVNHWPNLLDALNEEVCISDLRIDNLKVAVSDNHC